MNDKRFLELVPLRLKALNLRLQSFYFRMECRFLKIRLERRLALLKRLRLQTELDEARSLIRH